jgi:hypothetical protein
VCVPVLANLGGLVAIAGLEHVEPDLLLGALLEMGERLPQMKPSLVERMRATAPRRRSGRRARQLRARLQRFGTHRKLLGTRRLRAPAAYSNAPIRFRAAPGGRTCLAQSDEQNYSTY